MSKNETPDVALPFTDTWRHMEFEIERLRQENKQLDENLIYYLGKIKKLVNDQENLKKENKWLQQLNGQLIRKEELEIIGELKAENERLRKALEPFALQWDNFNEKVPIAHIQIEHLHDARKALGETE